MVNISLSRFVYLMSNDPSGEWDIDPRDEQISADTAGAAETVLDLLPQPLRGLIVIA